jgi:hypothetical protein
MKVKYKVGDKLEFEIDGAGQKEIFKELALIQEIFAEEKCGICGSNISIWSTQKGRNTISKAQR